MDENEFNIDTPRHFTLISKDGIDQFVAFKQLDGTWKMPIKAIELIERGAILSWNDNGNEEWYERGINR